MSHCSVVGKCLTMGADLVTTVNDTQKGRKIAKNKVYSPTLGYNIFVGVGEIGMVETREYESQGPGRNDTVLVEIQGDYPEEVEIPAKFLQIYNENVGCMQGTEGKLSEDLTGLNEMHSRADDPEMRAEVAAHFDLARADAEKMVEHLGERLETLMDTLDSVPLSLKE